MAADAIINLAVTYYLRRHISARWLVQQVLYKYIKLHCGADKTNDKNASASHPWECYIKLRYAKSASEIRPRASKFIVQHVSTLLY